MTKDRPPAQATHVGYNTQTLNSTFASAKFDMAGTNAPGKEWYLFNFFGYTPSSAGLTLSSAGLTIAGQGGINGQIATAATLGSGNFVGTAFGGGAYFEATIKFDPALVNTANGWPAFWGMAIEHLATGNQWAGQVSGYEHFIEADIFEYDIGNANQYGGALHDWYGQYGVTCSPGFCGAVSDHIRTGPSGINWNSFHKVGMLWVPATFTSQGSATFYLDDVQIGAPVTWSNFTNQSPPPTSPWTFGVFDQQHIPLILGSGVNQPLSVQSIKVWQASGNGNLVR